MEVTAIILDKENQEIKIYFGHTNYCVNAPANWQNLALYREFNNIKGPELIFIDINKLMDNREFDKLVSL